MSKVDLAKLRTIRHTGKAAGKARIRKHEDRGRVRAITAEHADGRVSAVVRPDTVRHTVSMKEL